MCVVEGRAGKRCGCAEKERQEVVVNWGSGEWGGRPVRWGGKDPTPKSINVQLHGGVQVVGVNPGGGAGGDPHGSSRHTIHR